MKKIVLFALLPLILAAAPRPTQDDFNACFMKNKDSIISVNGNYGVAVAPNLIAVVNNSGTKINNFVKYDPYLGLYLVKTDRALKVPVMADENDETSLNKSTWVANLSDDNSSVIGHIKSHGVALGDLDELNFDINVTAQLNSACCKLVGIAIGANKFIPNRYLRHFAEYEDVYYGDIGVSFEQRDDGFFVATADPLGRGKMLLRGDKILSVDGKKPSSLRLLNEAVLFAKKGSLLEFKVERGGNEEKFYVPVSGQIEQKQIKISEPVVAKNGSPKEPIDENAELNKLLLDWGVVVDSKLVVKRVVDGSLAFKFGIQKLDKILQIGSEAVKNKKDLREKIGEQSSFLLLLRRDGFDFFARVSR